METVVAEISGIVSNRMACGVPRVKRGVEERGRGEGYISVNEADRRRYRVLSVPLHPIPLVTTAQLR